MSQLHLQTHTQLGDHMVSYGIVKEFAKKYTTVLLYTKSGSTHIKNIIRLFSNISNVKIIIGTPLLNSVKIQCDAQWYRDIKTSKFNEEMIFDRHWYKTAGIPFNKKFDNFDFERNLDIEKDIYYNKLNLKDDEEFILVHEDPSRNFIIKKELLPKGIKIIQVGDYQNVSILDLLYTVEKAKEIHNINSVLRTFIDLMNIKHDGLYYHRYTRDAPSEQPCMQLKNWIILD
jgi:hypothetical protein